MGVPAEDRREQILQGALTCFAGKGYHRTTMDDIVAASGLSKGALYWYFRSKKEILLAVVDHWLAEADRVYQEATTQADSPRDRLRAMGQVYWQALNQDPRCARVSLEFWAQAAQDEEIRERFRRLYRHYREMVGAVLAEGVAAGQFPPVATDRLAGVLVAVMDGLFLQWWVESAAVDWPGVVDLLLGLLKGEDELDA